MNAPRASTSAGSFPCLVEWVQKRLAESIGLDARVVGRDAVSWAVRRRMRALGLATAQQYEQQLQCEPEWQKMLDALLVNETWFFRERDAFTTLVQLVLRQWVPANPVGPLHLLSIPCASGEEPFSMVMALLDAGFPHERLKVDALDLSSSALALAERGVYGSYSFRSPALSFRSRYFQAVPGGFLLNKNVRERVQFARRNFLDPRFTAGARGYDFIFCRNLLIYLHEDARRNVLSKLQSLLAPQGVLFVGLAEQLLVKEHGLNPAVPAPRSALFRSGTNRSGHMYVPTNPEASNQLPVESARFAYLPLAPQIPMLQSAFETRSPRPAREAPLKEARQLADAGKLREAAAMCEAGLRQDSTCAGAYYLLGLLREAGGEPGAIDCYRKALYLEPNHRDALLQMALLARKQGDLAGARLFWSRAERTQPGATQP
jgi:chemotaxis protein methyltransferase WspC